MMVPVTPIVRLGVIGWPIAHSLSPVMQGAALQALDLPWEYGAFAVEPGDLRDAVHGARALGLYGLNVTMPHKEAALLLCQPDPLARRVQAVNTLCLRDPGDAALPASGAAAIRGANTDVHGFIALCAEHGVPLRPGLRAVVLGAGGAARAVLIALLDAGASFSVASRGRPDLAPDLKIDNRPLPVLPLSAAALAPLLPSCDLLVDCTPRGLAAPADPAGDPVAALSRSHPELDLRLLPAHALILDLCVRPHTALTAAAAALGLRSGGGEVMLLHQGKRALEIWLGRPLPPVALSAMRQALVVRLRTG